MQTVLYFILLGIESNYMSIDLANSCISWCCLQKFTFAHFSFLSLDV